MCGSAFSRLTHPELTAEFRGVCSTLNLNKGTCWVSASAEVYRSEGQCQGSFICVQEKKQQHYTAFIWTWPLCWCSGGGAMQRILRWLGRMFWQWSYTCSTLAKSISSSQSYVQITLSQSGHLFLTLTLYCHLLSCKYLLSRSVLTFNKALESCMCTVSFPQL